jgi:general secretion pathway protein E
MTPADQGLAARLVAAGALAEDQLVAAQDIQAREGGRLADVLQKQRMVGEEALLRAWGEQIGLPLAAEIKPEEVDPELVADLPINFAKQYRLCPVRRNDGRIQVVVADPFEVFALDDVRAILGAPLDPLLLPSERVLDLITKVYARRTQNVDLGEGEEEIGGPGEELVDILDLTDEAPIIRWVNSLLFQAVKERASDIHIEPTEKDVRVRYRIDGVLYEAKRANRQYMASIISRVKIMAGLNIAEKRLPQDGRIRRRIAGKDIDMRVATAPGADGERVAIRLLDRTSVLLDLKDLGFSGEHLAALSELITRPHGILLVTGPTGSGKTTTLYACLSRINRPDINILTLEDPVEYRLEGISQIQVNPKIDLTFGSGLRSFLRHDPDVIMVGECRDLETAENAIQASLTGHLVFSTVHTNDAAGAITRFVEMGVQPFLVASTLIAVMAQRLVRRVCPQCREAYRPDAGELRQLGLDAAEFAHRPPPPPGSGGPPAGHLYRARGCARCLKTGYTGREGIYELLIVDDDIRALTLKNTDSTMIKKMAVQKGMKTLRDDGLGKVLQGRTTVDEVMRVTHQDVD